MDDINKLLGEEIKTEISNLSNLEDGSEEKSKAIEDLAKLYRLRIEEIKAETERNDQRSRAMMEEDKHNLAVEIADDEKLDKIAQRKAANLDRMINIGLQVGLAVGGWLVYDIWHRRGLKFEETGTITSPWTRNLVSKMTPKK